jgi:hypothetical protein
VKLCIQNHWLCQYMSVSQNFSTHPRIYCTDDEISLWASIHNGAITNLTHKSIVKDQTVIKPISLDIFKVDLPFYAFQYDFNTKKYRYSSIYAIVVFQKRRKKASQRVK